MSRVPWILVTCAAVYCAAACGGSPPPPPAAAAHGEASSDAPIPAPPPVSEEGAAPAEPGPSRQQREQRVIELLEGKVGEDQIPESAR